jgi:putative ABC transport system ATP-binding protein
MSALVAARGLSRRFGSGPAGVSALESITLEIAAGEMVVVRGASGAGKSTLLACLAGLERATAGSVRLLGADLGALSEEARARLRRERVGFVFQDIRLVAHLSARENARLGALVLGGARGRAAAARADELLGRFGVAHVAGRRPARLSRGEAQRVALARALAHRPAVVFADEPTASLDPANGAAVWALLGELHAEEGVAILGATHDEVPSGARVLHLAAGRLVDDPCRM